jgi:hypothetical protein
VNTRSVLECDGPPPLFPTSDLVCAAESARGLAQFKTWRLALAFCLLTSAFGLRAWGQYSLDWASIDGGGGTSTGGVYSVTGTIGQPDAGTMSGGNYTLAGGFWRVVAAIQTPGAPWLTITRSATNSVIISWPSPSTGFALLQNTNLNTTNWVSPPEPVNDNGTERFILVNPPAGNRFYRLSK